MGQPLSKQLYTITRENKGNSKGENEVVVLILWFIIYILNNLTENVIDKGYLITLERFDCINIIILIIYMFPHGVL